METPISVLMISWRRLGFLWKHVPTWLNILGYLEVKWLLNLAIIFWNRFSQIILRYNKKIRALETSPKEAQDNCQQNAVFTNILLMTWSPSRIRTDFINSGRESLHTQFKNITTTDEQLHLHYQEHRKTAIGENNVSLLDRLSFIMFICTLV